MGPSRSAICAAICAGLFVFAPSAKADTSYTITFLDAYTGGTTAGSATFSLPVTPVVGPGAHTYTPDSVGPITLLGVTYTVTPADATVSVGPDGSIQFSADDLTITPGGTCTRGGRPVDCGTPEIYDGIQILSNGEFYAYNNAQGGTEKVAPATIYGNYTIPVIAPAATPEPGSVTLLGTGLLSVAAAVRRRRRAGRA